MSQAGRHNMETLRRKLAAFGEKTCWRSLDELANTPEFQAILEDEFPSRAEALHDPASRREVLRVMSGMLAMAALSGCVRQPQEKILPYVRQPEDIIPGRPLMFATAMPFRGSAVGVLVESHEGRPTKVEGNPLHPASLGRTTPYNQTSTLDLYDPDRSQAVLLRGQISSWGRLLGVMGDWRQRLGTGSGLHILSDAVHSPTLLAQRDALFARYPAMRWHEYDPVGFDNVREGARLAFGEAVNTVYRLDLADVVLALDADFLLTMPGSIPYARQFFSRRHAESDHGRMNRLYVAEPTPSITGDKADHRIRMRAAEVEGFARLLAAQTGVTAPGGPPVPDRVRATVAPIARDLIAHRGSCAVIPGEQQPPAVHTIAHAMNQALGNVGRTVLHTEVADPGQTTGVASMEALANAMRARQVGLLVILGANPVYNAPADLDFAGLLDNVELSVHLGTHYDETAVRCHWHVPESHYLESWSDAVAYDGTVSIIQPLINPLYDSRTAHEMLASLTDTPDESSYQIVRGFWISQTGEAGFDDFWERTLHDGVMRDTAFRTRTVALTGAIPAAESRPAGGLEVVFRPDPTIFDGRFANNSWLQECPKPHSRLTWDNAALLSPTTASRLQLNNEDVIEIRHEGRSVQCPVWITPGQADDCVGLTLGYGRWQAGRVGSGQGYNAYAMRTSRQQNFLTGAFLRKTGGRWPLACTQDHWSMEGRDIVRWGSNQQFLANPQMFQTPEKEKEQVENSLYPQWPYRGYAWSMAIDQTACIGCQACVVACQAENNVPVVGKEEVRRSREMHWLRIDRYFSGKLDHPRTHFQPMLCQHCQTAPCEPVCPVAATLHNGDGLSQMVYNRCIGTRYCSNNCPYKVRRFNFLLYSDWYTASYEPMRNPDVTVRSRGVMEKCSFCVQRIQEAKIEAEKEGRRVREGEIVTACQGACPTDAIVFGDYNDPNSRVRKLRANNLAYSVLAELATQPRISYLAELHNPNPELEDA